MPPFPPEPYHTCNPVQPRIGIPISVFLINIIYLIQAQILSRYKNQRISTNNIIPRRGGQVPSDRVQQIPVYEISEIRGNFCSGEAYLATSFSVYCVAVLVRSVASICNSSFTRSILQVSYPAIVFDNLILSLLCCSSGSTCCKHL